MKRVKPELLACDIVKYPHHGKTEMYPAFYEALGARFAIVTAMQGMSDAGQRFLTNRHLPTVYTSVKDRLVHLVTDGEYWLCEQVPVRVQ